MEASAEQPSTSSRSVALALAANPRILNMCYIVWLPVMKDGQQKFVCTLCHDGRAHSLYHRTRHEQSGTHDANLKHFLSTQANAEPEPAQPQAQDKEIADDALRHLLSALTGGTVAPYPEAARNDSPPPDIGINWHLMEANDEGNLSLSADQQAVASIAEAMLERISDLPMSDDELEERSDDEEPPANEPEVAGSIQFRLLIAASD